jgi:hypothetical protein
LYNLRGVKRRQQRTGNSTPNKSSFAAAQCILQNEQGDQMLGTSAMCCVIVILASKTSKEELNQYE